MEIVDLIRRWQAGESQRAVAAHSGIARATVWKYLQAAQRLGLSASGPLPSEAQLVALAGLGRVATTRPGRATPALEPLAAQREQIEAWLREERLQLTRVQELLARDGCPVKYTTLRRFVRQAGLGRRATPPPDERARPLPPARFARPGAAFAHRRPATEEQP